MVTILVRTPIGEAATPLIVDKAIDLQRVVSTVEQIHGRSGLKLKSISNSKITVKYQEGPPTELGFNMAFKSGHQPPQFDFFPPRANPHQLLTGVYANLFAPGRASFPSVMRDFLTSLTLTLPLLTYLHKLQFRHGMTATSSLQSTSAEQGDFLRVHVLPRHATQIALQYFTPAGKAPKEVNNDSQPHMLGRFEIYQNISASRKPLWLVRPALEEFQAYSRPSYSSTELRDKLRQEIFMHRSDGQPKWIALDSAAGCPIDNPEPLLQAIHNVLWNWAKLANPPESKSGGSPGSNKVNAPQWKPSANSTNAQDSQTNRPAGTGKGNLGKGQPLPNGPKGKAQRPLSNGPNGRPMPPQSKVKNPKLSEIITLD